MSCAAFFCRATGSGFRADAALRRVKLTLLFLYAYALLTTPYPLLFAEGLPEAVESRLDAVVAVWAHDD